MSQKPANPREPVAEGALARDANAAENAQETREKTGSAATSSRRLPPAPGKGQTQSNVVRSNAVPAHARPPQHSPQHQVARATAGPIRAVAANDDMPSIGGLIYALQQRPSRTPFYVAMVASGVWFVLGMVVTWAMLTNNADPSASFVDLLTAPSVIAVGATIVLPIALFWFLAILVWRAQELRMMSSAMTEVAVRLAEPDKMAEQSVASLGQTVRRQVAAMNDAISRALGRAGELEALVHNEVAALERSYSENENRIRNLINELASEREALANNSDRVSEALRGIGTHVTREISAASERASTAMTQATSTLADTLASRGNKITAAVTAAGAVIDEKMAERGARITEQLVKHGAQAAEKLHQAGLEVSRGIQETSDRTAAAISAKGNSLVASVISMSERVGREIPVLLERLGSEQTRLSSIIEGATTNLAALEGALSKQTQSLDSSLNERTKKLHNVLHDHAHQMDSSLAERTQALEHILGSRSQAFEATLSERTKALDASVSRYTDNIRESMEQHGRSMEKSLGRQAASIQHVVTSTAGQIQRAVDELASRSGTSSETLTANAQMLKDVSSGLMNQIQGLTKRFEEQGMNIMNAARTLEVQNTKVDGVLESRQASLAKLMDSLNSRASDLDRMMHNYSSMLEQSLAQAEQRARQVTEHLARDSADKSQAAMKELERLRSEAQAHTSRAISELKNSFGSLSDQVTSQLSGFSNRFNETTQQVRDTAHQAANELEHTQTELRRQAKNLPETAKQSAKAMRRALQDQLSALDSLGEITARHGFSGQVAKPDVRPGQSRPGQAPHGQPHGNYDMPANMGRGDMGRPDRPSPNMPGRDVPGGFGDKWNEAPRDSRDSFDAIGGGAMERMDNNGPMSGGGNDYESMGRPPRTGGQVSDMQNEPRGGAQWSLGDLLARASEPDDNAFGHGNDTSYGMPPVASPPGSDRKSDAAPMVFDMKDIAGAIDESVAKDVWMRYHKGERHVINRNIYNRQGQATFDQARRRYENDSTFRAIVDRYLADFERMLHEAGKSDPKGRSVQKQLASETGRIYLLLGHASGRLGS